MLELKEDLSKFVKTTLCISIKTFFNTCESFWAAIPFIGIPSGMDKLFRDFTTSFGKVSQAVNRAVDSVNAFSDKMKQIQNSATNFFPSLPQLPQQPQMQLLQAQQQPQPQLQPQPQPQQQPQTQAQLQQIQTGGKNIKQTKISLILEKFFNTTKKI